MTLRPKFRLGVTGGDNGRTSAHAAQGGRSFKAQFPGVGHQEIAYFMSFEMTPHILDRIKFRGVGRKAFQDYALAGGGDVMLDQKTSMDRRAIPQDQNFARYVPLQVSEKLNDLGTFDAALMNLKVKPPQRQAANN